MKKSSYKPYSCRFNQVIYLCLFILYVGPLLEILQPTCITLSSPRHNTSSNAIRSAMLHAIPDISQFSDCMALFFLFSYKIKIILSSLYTRLITPKRVTSLRGPSPGPCTRAKSFFRRNASAVVRCWQHCV